MNENIDLTKILDGCPEGTEFYCSIYGVVKFVRISATNWIIISTKIGNKCISKVGRFDEELFSDDECIFFPSKDQRDWSKFERFWDKSKKEKFDVNTLQGNNISNIDKLKKISTPAEENWFKIAEEWEKEDK